MQRVSPRDILLSVQPLFLLLLACGKPGSPPAAPPVATGAAISPADLRARLYAFSDDSMLGRRSGERGGIKATDYLAAEARRLGLEPAGDGGSYFQIVPMVRRTLEPGAAVTVAGGSVGRTFRAWNDLIPRDQGKRTRSIEGAQAVYGGVVGDPGRSTISLEDAAGKLVVIMVAPDADGKPATTVSRADVTLRFATAAGVVVATLDAMAPSDRLSLQEAGAQLAAEASGPEVPAFMYASSEAAQAMLGAAPAGIAPGARGRRVTGSVRFVDSPTPLPARNVVARLPGSDPKLRGQIVAVGAHSDHDGIAPLPEDHDSLRAWNLVLRPEGANSSSGDPTAEQAARIKVTLDSLRAERKPRRDSVLNGADDDGSGSVAVLEIAEKLARGPEKPRRSVLFVWHAAEELGLLGSDFFTRHPTVPRDSIVAQLNIDMIGRGGPADRPNGGPGYLQLIGSRRLSTELGDLVERVNAGARHGFGVDYTYDADGHPDNYYCRSDHYMYARYGIPIAFFTTGSHRDYHQITDEPQYIDYHKLARVTRLVGDVALAVADLDHRPVVDKPKPDPNGLCRQ